MSSRVPSSRDMPPPRRSARLQALAFHPKPPRRSPRLLEQQHRQLCIRGPRQVPSVQFTSRSRLPPRRLQPLVLVPMSPATRRSARHVAESRELMDRALLGTGLDSVRGVGLGIVRSDDVVDPLGGLSERVSKLPNGKGKGEGSGMRPGPCAWRKLSWTGADGKPLYLPR